jgi:hypothetical protein
MLLCDVTADSAASVVGFKRGKPDPSTAATRE